MLKKRILCLVLVLCAAVVMTGCQQKETFPTTPQQYAEQPTANPEDMQNLYGESPLPQDEDIDWDAYDPSLEEGGDQEATGESGQQAVVPVIRSEYAGATPVPIDPVDKPTDTPLPPLVFTYAKYEAPALHLSFEAPEGWMQVETAADTYKIVNPTVGVDYQAYLSIRLVPVNKNYNKNELIKEVKDTLKTLSKEENFSKFEMSKTAGRKFMNTDAIYANYTATTTGTEGKPAKIAGRLIIACANKTLYVLHVSYPKGYGNVYIEGDKSVYNKFRHSVKTISATGT